MTTGARRGELCALRWSAVSLAEGQETMWLRRAIRKSADGLVEGDLKTHQQRRVALDTETAAALREHRERCLNRAEEAGEVLDRDAFVFSRWQTVAIRSSRQYRLTPPSRRTTPSRASIRCGWSSDSASTARHRLEWASDPTSRCAGPASPQPDGGSGSSSQSN
jgi:integrase